MKNVMGEIQTSGNIDTSTATSMTINSGAIGKLMGMFTNQYSNKNLAVIREYFCNGDDARIAAGSDRPTEVFLPTDLQPSLLIRDYGIGLDKHGLVVTFGTYGLSTKDDTNDQTGGFGIGSKVAFSMGQQFIVTGYKDGQMTTALFSLDKHGVGQVSIEHEGPTEEPNGVLVSLAVPNVDAMHRASRKFFQTVPKGRVLVDGLAPAHLFDEVDVTRVTDDAVVVKDGEGEIRVQMGPVVYPVNSEIRTLVAKRLKDTDAAVTANALIWWDSEDSLLFEVPMGALTIAPSREDLRDTDATVDALSAVVTGLAHHLVSSIQDRIDACSSYFEAAMVLHHEMDVLKAFKVKRDAFTYGGKGGFKHEVKVEIPTLFLTSKSWRSSNKIVGRDDKFTVTPERAPKVIVVAGVAKDDISKVSRYAKRFIENTEDVEYVMVAEEAVGEVEWFQWGTQGGATTWTLEDYRAALRAMRASNPRTRTEPSYTSHWYGAAERDLDDRDLLTDLIADGKPLLVFEESVYISSYAAAILEPLYTPVVLMPTQSYKALAKRVQDDGTVEIINAYDVDYLAPVRVEAEKVFATVTENERAALGAKEYLSDYSRKNKVQAWAYLATALGHDVAPSPIAHRVFNDVADTWELARIVAEDITKDRQEALRLVAPYLPEASKVKPIKYEGKIPNIAKVFPMLEHVSTHSITRNPVLRDEVRAYVNSKA